MRGCPCFIYFWDKWLEIVIKEGTLFTTNLITCLILTCMYKMVVLDNVPPVLNIYFFKYRKNILFFKM